jgi:hypothetical protein
MTNMLIYDNIKIMDAEESGIEGLTFLLRELYARYQSTSIKGRYK